MSLLYSSIFLIIIILIGIIRHYIHVHSLDKRITLVDLFLKKYGDWIDSDGHDADSLNWLLSHMGIVQDHLGATGLMTIKPPHLNILQHNMPVLLNFIPGIRRELGDPYLRGIARENIRFQILSIDESLRTYLGKEDAKLKALKRNLFNPIHLLCLGLSWIIQLPLTILYESKVISKATYEKNLEGVIVGLFTAISAIITIALSIAAAFPDIENVINKIREW